MTNYDLNQIKSEIETFLFYESGRYRFDLINKYKESNLYKLYLDVKESYPDYTDNEIIYRIFHNFIDEQRLCLICGKPRLFSGRFNKKEEEYSRTCSKECDKKRNFLIVRIEKKRINSRLIFWLVGD